jgi:hypothetical protein
MNGHPLGKYDRVAPGDLFVIGGVAPVGQNYNYGCCSRVYPPRIRSIDKKLEDGATIEVQAYGTNVKA